MSETFEELRTVEQVVELEHDFADVGIILNEYKATEARVHWLENLRDEYQWVGKTQCEITDTVMVHLREKDE